MSKTVKHEQPLALVHKAADSDRSLSPGPALMKVITSAANDGRSTWSLGLGLDGVPLLVPHVWRWRRVGDNTWAPDVTAKRDAARLRLGRRVSLALETRSDLAFDALEDQDRSTFRRLVAAASHDLLGTSRSDLADAFRWDRHSGSVGKRVREGRKLLASMEAWPWCYLAAPHDPDGWWSHPTLVSALDVWRTGDARDDLAPLLVESLRAPDG